MSISTRHFTNKTTPMRNSKQLSVRLSIRGLAKPHILGFQVEKSMPGDFSEYLWIIQQFVAAHQFPNDIDPAQPAIFSWKRSSSTPEFSRQGQGLPWRGNLPWQVSGGKHHGKHEGVCRPRSDPVKIFIPKSWCAGSVAPWVAA